MNVKSIWVTQTIFAERIGDAEVLDIHTGAQNDLQE